jgi:hypothetical protein
VLVAAGVIVCIALVWLGVSREPESGLGVDVIGEDEVAHGSFRGERAAPVADRSPEIVRIFTQVVQRDQATGEGTVGDPRPFADYRHAGPLDHLPATIESFERFVRHYSLQLQELDANPDADPVERAEVYHSLLANQLAIVALKDGTYVTTRKGDNGPPLTLPGAECILRGAKAGGEVVNLAVIMPYSKYPDLQSSRQALGLARHFRDWRKAQEFNLLPEEERRRIAERVVAILKFPNADQSSLDWIRRTIGDKVDLDTINAIVTVQPFGK